MGQNPKCPGYNQGKNQGDKFKYIFELYSFLHHRGAGQHSFNICLHVPRTEDVGLPTKFWFNVGPGSQLIGGSMPVNYL